MCRSVAGSRSSAPRTIRTIGRERTRVSGAGRRAPTVPVRGAVDGLGAAVLSPHLALVSAGFGRSKPHGSTACRRAQSPRHTAGAPRRSSRWRPGARRPRCIARAVRGCPPLLERGEWALRGGLDPAADCCSTSCGDGSSSGRSLRRRTRGLPDRGADADAARPRRSGSAFRSDRSWCRRSFGSATRPPPKRSSPKIADDKTDRGDARIAVASLRLTENDAEAAVDALAPVLDGAVPRRRRPPSRRSCSTHSPAIGSMTPGGRDKPRARARAREPDGIVFPFLVIPVRIA